MVHTEIAHVWPGVRPDQVVFTAGDFSQVSPGQSRRALVMVLKSRKSANGGDFSVIWEIYLRKCFKKDYRPMALSFLFVLTVLGSHSC